MQQHAGNPVDWYPWGEEAFNKAKNEKKLIFLSIGYSSCHWCHVMERESFVDPEIASFLNTHFVSIKVDREERPDVDSIYMEAVQMMSGHGGWPLNVWLTSELKPIYGGTYFPPETTRSHPGFMTVLTRLLELHQNEPETIEKRSTEIGKSLENDLFDHIESGKISYAGLKTAINTSEKNYDPQYGGFSPAPKFPSAMLIEFLLRYDKLAGDENARRMALHSLRKMCLGGIYDQIGGGFHRYSTDEKWLVPHFEKMLYDNALMISALTDSWRLTGEDIFKEVLDDTIQFVNREMTSEDGGFFTAIDADSEGVEGLFYIWYYHELEKLIPPADFHIFSAYYDVQKKGNWEGKIILNRAHSSLDFSILSQTNHDDFNGKVEEWKSLLLNKRSEKIRPITDTKIITSWNAMMLKALCKYWMAFRSDETMKMILQNADYLNRTVVQNEIVFRISGDGQVKIPGFCDDYALLAEAFGFVFQVTADEKWLESAVRITDSMIGKFYISRHKSFAYTEESQKDVIFRKKEVFDNATPSANSAALSATHLIGRLTGRADLVKISDEGCEALGSLVGDYAPSFGYLLQLISEKLSHHATEIVILGDQNEHFLEELSRRYLPFHIIINGNSLENPQYETLKGKKAPETGSNVYICKNFTCSSPVNDLESFLSLL